jgi:kynurenine formamidase
MQQDSGLPEYAALPQGPSGGRTAWGLFGAEDNLGMANLMTCERVAAAASLVRSGQVFALNAPLDGFAPPLASSRTPVRHSRVKVQREAMIGFDDVLDDFNPQNSSQWDALGHASYDGTRFYNDVGQEGVSSGARNTIDALARRGVACRGVLLDLAPEHGLDPFDPPTYTTGDLDKAIARTRTEMRTGDILLLHTGFANAYRDLSEADRRRLVQDLRAPGLEHTEEMAAYLWNLHPFALASDTFAVEAWPPDRRAEAAPFGFLHQMLLGAFGIWLGELWWLADLAASCREDGRFEFLVTSAPLHLRGGISSTANALAIK